MKSQDRIRKALLAGAIVDESGSVTLMRTPPGEFRMRAPRVAVTPAGTLDVLWLPEDTLAHPSAAVPRWSTWIDTGWTVPKAVVGTVSWVWGITEVSKVVIANGSPWLVADLSPGGVGISVTWTPSGWIARPIDRDGGPYTTLARASGSLRVMAYIDYGAPDGNAVYVRRSITGGDSWLPGFRVSGSGKGAATDPQLLNLGAERLALVWAASDGGARSQIQIATSIDRGQSWHLRRSFHASSPIVTLRAVADRVGTIHLILQQSRNGRAGTQPFYVEWSGGQWHDELKTSDSTESFGIATIGIAKDGLTTIAAWGEHQGANNSPQTVLTTIRQNCGIVRR